MEPRFYKHYFRSTLLVSQLASITQGIRQGQTIDMEAFGDLLVPVPPVEEQRRIADFLDAETAYIDRLSGLRNQQVELVGERTSAVIAARVDELASANGWIRLKRGLRSIEQGWSPQCHDIEAGADEYAVLKTSAVSSGTFHGEQHKLLPPELEPDLRYLVRDGDLLMTRGSGSPRLVGVAAVAETKGRKLLLSDLLYRVRLCPGWSSSFVACVLASSPVRSRMRLLMRGQSGQTIKLRAEDIREIPVPQLAVEEQSAWAAEVVRLRADADGLIRSLDRSRKLLEERRRAVVTAAVTGELDVTTARRAS